MRPSHIAAAATLLAQLYTSDLQSTWCVLQSVLRSAVHMQLLRLGLTHALICFFSVAAI